VNLWQRADDTEAPIIPGYRIGTRLGQGGMASVYLAIQQSFEREVALKVMSPLLNSDPSFAARFKREAHIVAQLNHASIVPVFDVGEHQSYHYLSMEYLPAGDLRRRILDGENDRHLAVKVCMALSAALETAHRAGFVHRDIKPENILFREDDTPVLTDFGIARALDGVGSMTMAGMLVGTPDYMSPEQVKGLELDGRSDLYSVGIVFYEILTGSAPFKGDSTLSVALKQVGESLPLLPPEYAQFQEFLDCLTAKDREERFASGAEVVRALRLLSVGRSGRDRTLIRSGASLGSGLALTSSPEAVVAERSGMVSSQPNPRDPDLVEGDLEGPKSLSAVEREYVEQESSLFSKQGVLAVPNGVVIAKHEIALAVDGALGAHGSSLSEAHGVAKPSQFGVAADRDAAIGRVPDKPEVTTDIVEPVIQSVPLGAQSGATPPNSADVLQPDSGTKSVRNRPLWFAAAGVAAVVIYIGAVFVAKPNVGTRASASTQPKINPQPAIPIKNPRAPAAQAILPARPAGVSTSQHPPIEQTADAPTSSVTSDVASGTSRKVEAVVATKVEEPAEAAARRKLLLAERRQRKAEEARLAAEQARATLLAAQQSQIQDLLAAAKTQYRAGALWQPAGSNAADSYRAILAMQPQHAEALAGAERLANVLADEAEAAEASGDLDSSKQLIDQVQALQPTHSKLPDLQARFQQLQTSPAALDARSRGRLEKAAKYIRRAEEDLDRKPLDFKAVDDATDQYDRALSTAPKAPGLPSLRERLIVAYPTAVQAVLDLRDTRRAQKLIGIARKRNWSSPELDQLEATLRSGSSSDAAVKNAGVR
jgi:serine/threonine protein kinase/tetratricopeptide (TPR) repeat protein